MSWHLVRPTAATAAAVNPCSRAQAFRSQAARGAQPFRSRPVTGAGHVQAHPVRAAQAPSQAAVRPQPAPPRSAAHPYRQRPPRPRPGYIKVGGFTWLGRMIDKARLRAAGLGDYIYPCPSDRQLLQQLGLTSNDFLAIIHRAATDDEVLGALQARVPR